MAHQAKGVSRSGRELDELANLQSEETVSWPSCHAQAELTRRYNPVLGEFFRCTYTYADGTEGFYIAEQVSHHPVCLAIMRHRGVRMR